MHILLRGTSVHVLSGTSITERNPRYNERYSSLQKLYRGAQGQFSEIISSEDDLRSRIFANICCRTSCLPASPRIFEHLKNGIIAHF